MRRLRLHHVLLLLVGLGLKAVGAEQEAAEEDESRWETVLSKLQQSNKPSAEVDASSSFEITNQGKILQFAPIDAASDEVIRKSSSSSTTRDNVPRNKVIPLSAQPRSPFSFLSSSSPTMTGDKVLKMTKEPRDPDHELFGKKDKADDSSSSHQTTLTRSLLQFATYLQTTHALTPTQASKAIMTAQQDRTTQALLQRVIQFSQDPPVE
jgi:hypothetical protein